MSVVYFIKPEGFDGPVKIGVTVDMAARLRAAACWSPFPLEVIATFEGDASLEHQFHALFEADHLRLEWFAWSPEMASVVAAINDGTFDFNVLPEPKYVGLSKVMREWARPDAEQADAA